MFAFIPVPAFVGLGPKKEALIEVACGGEEGPSSRGGEERRVKDHNAHEASDKKVGESRAWVEWACGLRLFFFRARETQRHRQEDRRRERAESQPPRRNANKNKTTENKTRKNN